MTIFELTLFGIKISPSYYGLMYLISFVIGYFIIKKKSILDNKSLDDLVFYLFLGVLFGGRIGYILFYNLSFYINNPVEIIQIWNGGMSFHGGLIGFILATLLFCRKYKIQFWDIMDNLAVVAPIGLFFGRIGNYLNQELLGNAGYNGFLAIKIGDKSYFPSTLLEAFLEGFVLFLILFLLSKKQDFKGQISSVFLIMYGIFRGFVEFFYRQPDSQLGYVFGDVTMGALLSIPMIIAGLFIFITFILDEKSLNNFLIIFSILLTIISFFYKDIIVFGMHKDFLDTHYYLVLLQFLLYNFLHGGLLHLFMNMAFLWYFGTIIENMLGFKKYLGFFVFSTIFNGISILLFSSGVTVGISGFLLGLLTFFTLYLYDLKNDEYKGGITAIIINIAVGFSPGISLVGHLFGAISGILFFYFNKYLGGKSV